ncbi:hypothetical protein [Chishuiella changwenlii]|uniref:hypothetical protein n=1 Tax=Chishuiella changwenlii TaxID=1434701 RepID=UPI002FDA887D
MNTINYFKLQAKNLHKDFKTKTLTDDISIGGFIYEYNPKYFRLDLIISDFNIDEKNITLMKLQHVIAKMANFDSWDMLLNASPDELDLAKLLYDYQNRIDLISWLNYIKHSQSMNEIKLDTEIQINIFKQVVIEDNIFDMIIESYLLCHDEWD